MEVHGRATCTANGGRRVRRIPPLQHDDSGVKSSSALAVRRGLPRCAWMTQVYRRPCRCRHLGRTEVGWYVCSRDRYPILGTCTIRMPASYGPALPAPDPYRAFDRPSARRYLSAIGPSCPTHRRSSAGRHPWRAGPSQVRVLANLVDRAV